MTEAPTCRSCGAVGLRTFLSLGKTPLADALVDPGRVAEPEARFPLEVAFCPGCSLVQILEEVPPEQLFVDNYLYFSSFSDHLLDHSRRHALGLIDRLGLDGDSLVVELASNDGYLLKNFADAGIPVLGVDPAPDQADAAEAIGIPTVREFFGPELATELRDRHGAASVIIANNVMAHVPDLNGFVEGMRILVADDGLITVENPSVRDLVDHCEFDTIYHEHHCYFSCSSVDALVARHDLHLNDVEYFPGLHGGTLRWHIAPEQDRSDRLLVHLAAEQLAGLTSYDYYERFAERVERTQVELVSLLRSLREDGASIAAYGAAAKGSTLLSSCDIGTDLIDFVVDRNTYKHGKLMPGVHIPITGPEALLDRQPDYVLLLAWNFRDEILLQQDEYRRRGGLFVVPVPEPVVV